MYILLLFMVIALIIVIFAVQNAVTVPVQFLIWSSELPLALIIFFSVFAGVLLMFCLALWRELKTKIGQKPKSSVTTEKSKTIDLSTPKSTAENLSTEQSKPNGQ
ncbi:MAG: LapA family protein [Desulfitobacteriia bacterium]|jgi:putative membrane protein